MLTGSVRSVALILPVSLAIACSVEEGEIVSTLESSVVQCSAPDPSTGIAQIHPNDPYRLAINGETWLPVGYYNGSIAWADAAYGLGPSAVATANHDLIDQLSGHGLNFYRTWLTYSGVFDDPAGTMLYPYVRSGPGAAADNGLKLNLDEFDPTYFDVIADAVDYANTRGVVAHLILIHCGLVEYSGGAYAGLSFYDADNNVQGVGFSNLDEYYATSGPIWDRHRDFVEQVVTTVGDRPNIVWEVCNEKSHGFSAPPSFDETRNDPFFNAVVDVIRSLGSSHLVIGTDLPQHTSVAGHLVPQADPDIDAFHASALQQRAWGVPLISDNDCCSGEADATLARQKGWAALTAGAHVNMFSEASALQGVLHGSNAQRGMRYLGYLRSFVGEQCIELAGMVPDDSLVESGNGWALTRPGEEIIAYARWGGALSLGGLPASYQAVWLDPTNGASQAAGAGPTFVPPGSNAEGDSDWVLFVRESTQGGYSCPGGIVCDGTPVTGSPDEVVCGTNLSEWVCTSSGWVDTGAGCSCGASECPFPGALVGKGGKVVDVEWGSAENGSIVQIYLPHGGANQRWELMSDGTLRVSYGKCLTALDGDTVHSRVAIWDCNGSANQQWWSDSQGLLHMGSRCLDIPWGDPFDGNDLQLYDCHGGDNQRWMSCP